MFGAQDRSRSAQFQITQGNLKSSTEIVVLCKGFQALLGDLGTAFGNQKIGVGTAITAPHASSHLIELRDAKGISPIDEDGIGIGDVDAIFDDGGADQDLKLVLHKGFHHFFQMVLRHLSVPHHESNIRHFPSKLKRNCLNRLHSVVHKENLTATIHFTTDSIFDHFHIPHGDDGANGQAFFGGGLHQGDFLELGQCHIEGTRDGCGAHI